MWADIRSQYYIQKLVAYEKGDHLVYNFLLKKSNKWLKIMVESAELKQYYWPMFTIYVRNSGELRCSTKKQKGREF